MMYGISLWLPYHGTGTVASAAASYYGGGLTKVESYAFWSNAAPSLGSGIDIRVRQLDYDTLRRLYQQWRQLSRYYYGDFYPLTPYTQDNRQWIAWQFHDPQEQAGAIQAFRRDQCPADGLRLRLYDLDPNATYRFTVLEGQSPAEATGNDLLAQGLPVSTPQRPGAVVPYTTASEVAVPRVGQGGFAEPHRGSPFSLSFAPFAIPVGPSAFAAIAQIRSPDGPFSATARPAPGP